MPRPVRIIGEVPPRGEQDSPTVIPAVHTFGLPGANENSVMLRPGSLGNVIGTPRANDAAVIVAPPSMSIGSPVDSAGLPEYVNVEPAPTSVELAGLLFVSFSLKVIPVGVTVTVPGPPVSRVPTTVANDGIAVKKMRPKPDPIRLNRAKYFIGSSLAEQLVSPGSLTPQYS